LLAEAGLAPGMACLDLGCGGGGVAPRLAASVGAQGRGIGVGTGGNQPGLGPGSRPPAGAAQRPVCPPGGPGLGGRGPVHCVYARFPLTPLPDPLGVLRGMLRAARPGGVAVVEDIDFGGHFCSPPCAGFDAYVRLYRAAAARLGADADIGPKLHGMLLDAGWRNPQLHVIQPAFTSGEGKQLALLTLINIADSVLAGGLATEGELQSAVDDLARFTDDPRTLISLPRIFQLWGRRE